MTVLRKERLLDKMCFKVICHFDEQRGTKGGVRRNLFKAIAARTVRKDFSLAPVRYPALARSK